MEKEKRGIELSNVNDEKVYSLLLTKESEGNLRIIPVSTVTCFLLPNKKFQLISSPPVNFFALFQK